MATVSGAGGVALLVLPFGGLHLVGLLGAQQEAVQLVVQHGGGQYERRAPANAHEAGVFKAHPAPLGLCDNMVTAVKRLANQQKAGDRPIESAGYNRSAVDVGGPRRGTPGR